MLEGFLNNIDKFRIDRKYQSKENTLNVKKLSKLNKYMNESPTSDKGFSRNTDGPRFINNIPMPIERKVNLANVRWREHTSSMTTIPMPNSQSTM